MSFARPFNLGQLHFHFFAQDDERDEDHKLIGPAHAFAAERNVCDGDDEALANDGGRGGCFGHVCDGVSAGL